MDKLTNNQITSIHLLNLSHSVPLNPLSKVYKDTFADFTNEKCINLPANYMEDTFCDKCESIFIPGITVSTRIIYKKSKSGTVSRRRLLRYTCLECYHKSDRALEMPTSKRSTPIPNSGTDTEANNKSSKPEEFKATWPKSETSKSKQRLKKRKQNNLSNLLAMKKKEKENESKQFNSLSLMEFMNK
ncbi:uncharacterized protein AC631_04821 [Debaryomyces fabryi]|uniref:Uncharacterized protein n=1 Tax=Debaryomyces fabryi TaxID=58627 RepID=A0A0V1PTC0_9ASCO|nr:uncharacterized protein AC631_04821 [Debaryomyces fabryi]KRZ99409.1 hypothetical protein AC631_04821 [Debaryomyces fabryi]CUM46184.1 unnamed protein product [Debaryomyces fabryi]